MTTDGITARLHELMGESEPAAFARKCGIPDSSMRQYLKGSIPGADKAARIAEKNSVNLQWLITGEGPQFSSSGEPSAATSGAGFSEDQAPYQPPRSAGLDPELLGRIMDVVERVHLEGGVRLPAIEKGRLVAEKYAEIAREAADAEEWPALLDLLAVRLKKALRSAAIDPASSKREA